MFQLPMPKPSSTKIDEQFFSRVGWVSWLPKIYHKLLMLTSQGIREKLLKSEKIQQFKK
jgi:hypothetical protein